MRHQVTDGGSAGGGVEPAEHPGLKCRRSLSYARQVESDKRFLPAFVLACLALELGELRPAPRGLRLYVKLTSPGLNHAHSLLSLTSDFR